MSDAPIPNNFIDLVSAILFGIFAFAFGFEAVVAINGGQLLLCAGDIVACLLLAAVAVLWLKHKEWLPQRLVSTSMLFVTDWRWLFGAFVVLLCASAISPYVEQQRWPFTSQLASLTSEIANAGRPAQVAPDEIAAAIIRKLPPQQHVTFPSLNEIAEAVVGRIPKQAPVQPPIPTAAEIAKELVRQSPQVGDNQSQQKIQELTTALNASNKARDETAQELNNERSRMLPKSPLLGLDDAKRWQLFKSIRDASFDSQGKQLDCHAIGSVDAQDKLGVALFSELEDIIAKSWNITNTEGFAPPPHQPFGVTFLVGIHSGNAFTCANHVVGALQNALQVPISIKIDQVSDNLVRCNNECIEIRYGGER